jgi:2-oxo-3-(phosphooxy)propyl 3-oxoalkanoate synthase
MAAGSRSIDLILHVDVSRVGQQTPSVVGMKVVVEFFCGDRWIARGTGWARCLAPRLYERLRGGAPAGCGPSEIDPVDRSLVGMCVPDDVVIGASTDARTYPLRVQLKHPILFDHPLDHVPGMTVLEGMRQVGRLACGWPYGWIAAADVRFDRFLELGSPSCLSVLGIEMVGHRRRIVVQAGQASEVAATATLELIDLRRPRQPATSRPPAVDLAPPNGFRRGVAAVGPTAGNAAACEPGRVRAARAPTCPEGGG